MRRLGVFLGVGLVALALSCTPRDAPPPDVPHGSEPLAVSGFGRPLPRQLIDELMAETESVRELRFREPVEAISVTPAQLERFIGHQIKGIEMRRAQTIMRAFEFIPANLDLESLLVELYGAEVIGLYDPNEGRLMVLRSIANRLDTGQEEALEARAVLVHELTHALQDQHFETLDHTSEEAWTDDAGAVYSCLAEGDATLAMIVASIRGAGVPIDVTLIPQFRQQAEGMARGALPASAALSEAPPYFGHVMAATYFEGLTFAADLRRLGGWQAVDEAHRHPPRGTRDILHPDRYLRGQPIWDITLPSQLPGLRMPAYLRIHTATLGELETGAFLLPLEDDDRLRRAAAGWAGDRFAVYRSRHGEAALAWRLRFETPRDAGEFFEAAVETTVNLGRGPCRGRIRRDDPLDTAPRYAICAEGFDRIDESDVDVAVVRNVPPDSAEALAEALLAATASEMGADPPMPSLLERISEL